MGITVEEIIRLFVSGGNDTLELVARYAGKLLYLKWSVVGCSFSL
jgi:hypothetical protein